MAFNVSVIIPVYNAEAFLEKAIMSAVVLPEVGEVVVVDDGSTDQSLKICQDLARANNPIVVLQHTDRKNHGVSASRNLGIMQSRYPFVAFLDADDYYLPNRFVSSGEIFLRDPHVDGVYDAAQYETDFLGGSSQLYTIAEPVAASDLFYCLLRGRNGFFCTNTITIRKSLFQKSGLFLPGVRMHEDSELWLRLAWHGVLVPGNVRTPVAILRRHAGNTNPHRSVKTLQQFYEIVIAYYSKRDLSQREKRALLYGYWRSRSRGLRSHLLRRVYFYFFFYCNLIFSTLKSR